MMRRSAVLIALMAALAGCGSDVDETQSAQTVLAVARQVTARGAPPATGPVGLTRAVLDSLGRPADLVTVGGLGVTAVVLYVGENRGVETWSSVDDRTISVRQGMLTATRGLVSDLIAAETPPLSRVASGGGTFVRTLVTLNGEDAVVRSRYLCEYSVVGSEDVVLVERRYATRRVQESCSGDDGRFVNDHWFQGGTLRQTRQWAGHRLGYITIGRLRD